MENLLRLARRTLLRRGDCGLSLREGEEDGQSRGFVPATRIGEIVHERRRITAETALRLARYFKTDAEFWLNLQNFYDLEVTKRSGKV